MPINNPERLRSANQQERKAVQPLQRKEIEKEKMRKIAIQIRSVLQ